MTDRPTMIFHVPFALGERSGSASGIRPVRMRRAFESLGYEVVEISGRHAERRRRIADAKRRISSGCAIDFVYSESMTAPTGFGEPITLATSVTRDLRFLRFCRRAGIPVGLFYRDIYWKFQRKSGSLLRSVKEKIRRWRYIADLRGYEVAVDRLYVPSMRMASYLPAANQSQAAPLPPACEPVDSSVPDLGLSILYVGGVGDHYRLTETVRGVEAASGARLTICTRESEWRDAESEYRDIVGDSTTIAHLSGSELERLYSNAHIGALLMEPAEYREFAAPMKLYEYLGHAKPVIATKGSFAGDFVEENGVGWAIPYEAAAMTELSQRLIDDPALLESARRRATIVREQHTWQTRAEHVVDDLTVGIHRQFSGAR